MKKLTLSIIIFILFSTVNDTSTYLFADGGGIDIIAGDAQEKVTLHDNGKKKSAALYKKTKTGQWVPDGIVKTWYPSGKKRGILAYKMGVPHGIWKSYFESGQQYNEREFDNGKLINTTTTWHENGKMSEKTTF